MKKRSLGRSGLEVSALGFGAMALSGVYEPVETEEALATLRHAVEQGVTLIDTADFYGKGARSPGSEWGHNERLVGRAISGQRDGLVISTKGGYTFAPDGSVTPNGHPDYLQTACEGSLQRLGVEVIDLYYLHRVDPQVPVEESVGALARLVQQGKVRHIGLSEAKPDEIRRGHATHPLTALQSEYSLLNREPEAAIIPVCRELGIGFVPFAPLARGLLSGAITTAADMAPQDWRRSAAPRFQADNLAANLQMVAQLDRMARARQVSTAQLAIAWVLHQGEDVAPLAGATRPAYVDANLGAVALALDAQEVAEISAIFPVGAARGASYPEEFTRAPS